MTRQKDLLQKRNAAIYERYKHLHDVDFLQKAKCIEKVMSEFYLGEAAIKKVLVHKRKEQANAVTNV